jgi:hypothetical protein
MAVGPDEPVEDASRDAAETRTLGVRTTVGAGCHARGWRDTVGIVRRSSRIGLRRRMGRILQVVVVLAGGVPLATAAAASTGNLLTKRQLDVRAGRICQVAYDGNALVALGPRPTDAAAILQRAAMLEAIGHKELSGFDKLRPPASLARLWRDYVRGTRREVALVAPTYHAVARGDEVTAAKLFAEGARQTDTDAGYARKLGALDCL